MSFAPSILTSLHGRRLGLSKLGELVLGKRDGVVPAVVNANVAASGAISNTTAETAFDAKYTLRKNSVRSGTVVKVKFQGIAAATNLTDTLQIRLRIGGLTGTALLVGTATDVADNNIFAGEFTLIFRSVGASGTMVGYGTHTDVPAASGTASHAVTEILASTTVDTTADQDIVVTAQWSAQSTGDSCRLDLLVVEIA